MSSRNVGRLHAKLPVCCSVPLRPSCIALIYDTPVLLTILGMVLNYRFIRKLQMSRKFGRRNGRMHIGSVIPRLKAAFVALCVVSAAMITCLVCFFWQPLDSTVSEHCTGSLLDLIPPAADERPLIIIVTPTYPRPARIAQMTSLSQTLMHVRDIAWLVIEDSHKKSRAVSHLLRETHISHCYFAVKATSPTPHRGWEQRDFALRFIRIRFANFANRAIVYFADDDNMYDIRLFDSHVRNVKRVGVWAVGLSAMVPVEAPDVDERGIVTRWLTTYKPNRFWGIDMAGFAINLQLILHRTQARFYPCKVSDPESCLMGSMAISRDDVQPFGHDGVSRDILVWHTKNSNHPNKTSFSNRFEYFI